VAGLLQHALEVGHVAVAEAERLALASRHPSTMLAWSSLSMIT